MITFDAEKFMDMLDCYIDLRTGPPVSGDSRENREAEERDTYRALLEQLKVLEDTSKTTDRMLLAQVEIAGLVESANKFIEQKETMPFAALGCVVRALTILADLGDGDAKVEEKEPSA